MIPCEILAEITNGLAESIDLFTRPNSVMDNMADYYGISMIDCLFEIAKAEYTQNGENKKNILYDNGRKCRHKPAFIMSYNTEEGGKVSFEYFFTEETKLDDEIKTDLKILSDIIFMHCGRWRLAYKLKVAYQTDALTGLPNVGGYLTYIDVLLDKHELQKYNSFYFNLSHFSLVNQKFGDHESDQIIKRYSELLSGFLQDGECLGRISGDNFVAIVLKERADAFLQLLSGVETFGIINGERISVRISATTGVFVIDDNVKECGKAISAASVALNEARFVRKCPVVYSDRALQERVFNSQQLAEGFNGAIENRDFLVYYQPKVCSDDGKIVGAEALSRWRLNGSIIMPGSFIPIFEQNGMVRNLDFYVLEQVCRDIGAWSAQNITPVRISVNFSRKHIGDGLLAERITEIIGRYEIPTE